MNKHTLILIFIGQFICSFAFAQFDLRPLTAKESAIRADLQRILQAANFPLDKIDFVRHFSEKNYANISCENDKMLIKIHAQDSEWSAVLYVTLQRMGFLFPHPRMQISPKKLSPELCGQRVEWQPVLKYRGSHLHTLHPSEWVHGFMLGKTEIANETIRWLARNQQNIFDFSLLRVNKKQLYKDLKAPFDYAADMGVHAGVTFGVAFHQQNSWKLVSIFGSMFGGMSKRQIDRNLNHMLDNLNVSFMSVEAGTTEFTATNYKRALKWLNQTANIAAARNVQMLNKVHISSNQSKPKYGNFNLLAQHADATLGVLPHTVFYYSLNDTLAPMYGNRNFHHMRDFMLQERGKRMTWYYPETSYFIAMDIDIPMLHVEYLRSRAEDMRFLYENGIEGQLNFTTGHELGYWLMDWTLTLLNNVAYDFDPLIGVKLLGEDATVWQKHLDFHRKFMTGKQLTPIVTFANGGDEIFPKHAIHKRNLLKHLFQTKDKCELEIRKLEDAIPYIPTTEGIQNEELKSLLDITYLRFYHALYVRKALIRDKAANLSKATYYRVQAQLLMDDLIAKYNRYPEAKIFEEHKNPTAYSQGYGERAAQLFYWYREEEMVRKNKYGPLFMKPYDYLDILF